MRKHILFALSLIMVASLLFSACGTAATEPAEDVKVEEVADEPEVVADDDGEDEPAADEKVVLDIWSFTNEIMTMAVAYQGLHPELEVNYTMIPMTDGEYQTKLLAALGTADTPDVIALESAFVRSYVESDDVLIDLGDLLPYAEELDVYDFVTDVGTYDGVTKAFAYQATPGAVFYRRSLALEYFGTDDPVAIQELMSDLDGFTAMAETIKEKSGGKTFMVGSNAEFQNPFFANREQPWVVDDTLVIDPMVDEYVAIAKLFRENGYEAQAGQWSEGWFAGMSDTLIDVNTGDPIQIFSYFLPTWGLPYVLAPNAADADGGSDTSGDWGVVTGPLPYQWGGTWLGIVQGSPNEALAKDFIRFATLDEENLTNWATGVYTNEYLKAIDPSVPDDQAQAAGDFVGSKVVVDKIISYFDDSAMSQFLGGQNSYGGFADAAPSVSARLLQGTDDAIQRALGDPVAQYLNGEIDLDTMWSNFKESVATELPDVMIP